MSGVADITVTHGRDRYAIQLPLSSTLRDIKTWLHEKVAVPVENQILLLNAPVSKEFRRCKSEQDTTPLLLTFSASLQERIRTAATPQTVKLNAMLIGTSQSTLSQNQPQLNTETAAALSRIVVTTLEQDSRWFRCSYGQGYLRQTAYVCRTCVDEGRAAPDHAVCLACTEVCHLNHNIEEWGVRYHMRCDCCTSKCWRTPTQTDSQAEKKLSQDAQTTNKVSAVSLEDVGQRTKRKRSRSMSPIKSPVGPGGSPLMGIRVPAVVNTPSPFAISDPPGNEKEAVSSPIRSAAQKPSYAGAGLRSPPMSSPPVNAQPFSSTPKVETETAKDQGVTVPGAPPSSAVETGPAQHVALLPSFEGCRFVLDNTTNKPPEIIIPPNARNRYPRTPLTWCFCHEEDPGDEESGGLVCMICTSCFWNTHITSVHAEQFKRVPCYGDVVQGETVVFKCHTCDTHVCAPCRHRCHKDHEVDEECLITSDLAQQEAKEEEERQKQRAQEPIPQDGIPRRKNEDDRPKSRVESTASGVLFSCGCRGLCSIAESISPHEVNDPSTFLPFSDDTTNEMMNSDIFTGFVCAHCMQEHPWLLHNDFKKCYNGKLPDKVTSGILPPLPCGSTREDLTPDDKGKVYPYHGMILPLNAFSEEMICSCAPCQEAFDTFFPWAREDAANMMMNLCDQCDACHRSIRDKSAFLCRNCEMTMSDAFMLCTECNAHREKMVEASARVVVAQDAPSSGTTEPLVQATYTNSEGAEVTYEHDLSHQFMEDTQENLYALCGMQLVNAMEEEDRAYLSEHWDEVQEMTPELSFQGNFGPTPIEFTQEELKEIARANSKRPNSK